MNEKMSRIMLERWRDPAYRKRMSEVHRGVIPSEESRRKRSISMRLAYESNPNLRKMRAEIGRISPRWLVGRKLSEEHKKKISRSMSGCKKTRLHRERLSLSLKGRGFSTESRHRMSEAQKRIGSRPPSQRGATPWNYRGATKLQAAIRKTFEYLHWRADVFIRDKFTCVDCDAKGRVNAHHIVGFMAILRKHNIQTVAQAIVCKALWRRSNGVTLCVPCHKKRHKEIQ